MQPYPHAGSVAYKEGNTSPSPGTPIYGVTSCRSGQHASCSKIIYYR